MKLAEKLLSILESLKYEKKEDKNGNHELVAKSPQGEVSISVYAHKDGGEDVYLIDIGSKRVFEAGNDNDTVSVSKAKQIVDMFIKSRKFNPEKWLKSSSYVGKFLKEITYI